MNILNLLQQDGIPVEHVSRGEYHSSCPECGGRDRFSCWPEKVNSSGRYRGGRFCCRGCNWNGDAINYLQKRRALSFRDACKCLEIETGIVSDHTIRRSWTPAPAKALPSALWQSKAQAIVVHCSEQLQGNSGALKWLNDERGLTDETIRASRLGWNSKDLYLNRSEWGLSSEISQKTGKSKKLWIPQGLVIPYHQGKSIARIRVRRSEPPKNGNRYIIASGSNMQPMALWADQNAVMVVESELDAILINQEAGDLIGVIALGSSAIKPDSQLDERLMNASRILCALDNDEAGIKAVSFWRRYPGYKRWPSIKGKDCTEQMKFGVPVRMWIEAGL